MSKVSQLLFFVFGHLHLSLFHFHFPAQKEPPLSSSLCRVETSDIVEGPWCSSSVRGAGWEERRTNSFERTRGFGQLRETTSGERH
jgi:hypothetical protein